MVGTTAVRNVAIFDVSGGDAAPGEQHDQQRIRYNNTLIVN